MFLDFLLVTIVVPILPNHLLQIENSKIIPYLDDARQELNVSRKDRQLNHEEFAANNIPLAMLMSSKAIAQIPTSLIVSQITYRIGYDIPLFGGFAIFTLSSLIFAYSTTYNMLLFGRAFSGVGSGFAATSGMGMVANTFTDQKARSRAIAIVFSGIAIGILLGPVFGGLLYRIGGIRLPFLILAGLSFFVGLVQLFVLKPKVCKIRPEHTDYWKLLCDPYLMLTTVAIFINNWSFSAIEPTMPLWMIEMWNSNSVEQGLAFLPSSLAYLVWTFVNKYVVKKLGQWASCMAGFLILGAGLIVMPYSGSFYYLLIPSAFLGVGFGLVGLNTFPLMGHIADLRHTKIYGSVYAIADVSCSLAFISGPMVGGPTSRYFGFHNMMVALGIVNIMFAPLMIFLRKLEESKSQLTLTSSSSTCNTLKIESIQDSNLKL
ncbi:unnamed protein product [Bursaphelenchus okinawaensis]|uniref:Major facilitator superfamily (MFS) profile domain-containing protein n=1 Tax=Bursaphelenchus okinawaensis TaxID=465554 RepID=A0A811L2Y6_9BILA|nr:unnamed protein product [Bursaphelenchus okinawaensis]CAG9115654.1 unnamed protein product [Bursaphelenchus okinawaensis]